MGQRPGWYTRPDGQPGTSYWWDGTAWTGEVWQPEPIVMEPVSLAPLRSVPIEHDRHAVPAPEPTAVLAPAPTPAPAVEAPVPPTKGLWGGWFLPIMVGVAVALGLWWYQEQQQAEFIELDTAEPTGPMAPVSLNDAEQWVASYELRRDDDDSYVTAGVDIVRAFGVELRWGDPEQPSPCTGTDQRSSAVVAWFCSADPYIVWLNRDAEVMPDFLYTIRFTDTVKHELAHHIIFMRCGTTSPPIAGEAYEGVTNSYAVLYLGADRDRLQRAADDEFAEYTMTPDTDAAAMNIHHGTCG